MATKRYKPTSAGMRSRQVSGFEEVTTSKPVKSLVKTIDQLIKNNKLRKKLQKLSITNFYLTHEQVTKAMDNYRS